MKQMGYLLVDHRASPGLPEDIARQAGYDPKLCREGKLYEADTIFCKCCRSHVIKNPFRTRERSRCWICDCYRCDVCDFKASQPDYVHRSLDEVIEQNFKAELTGQGSPPKLLLP